MNEQRMTTYNNVLGVFSYAAHTLANTLWSERALTRIVILSSTFDIFGKSPIKWRQRLDITIAVDWDVKHQLTNQDLFQT